MRKHFRLIFFLLVVVQVILGTFLYLGPYVTVCILPLLILCLPTKYGDVRSLFIAFGVALGVDFFTHGILGLSVTSLLAVAFARRWVVVLVFGSEIYSRGEDLSSSKQGVLKMALGALLCTAIFFAVYVWVDAAGTRSFGFNLIRWASSTLASTLVQVFLTGLLTDQN